MQTAAGVAHLHARRLLHLDLNPKNILLAADMTPRIADFGCSVRHPQPPHTPSLSSSLPPTAQRPAQLKLF
jgi:serine/threonine protein kinase